MVEQRLEVETRSVVLLSGIDGTLSQRAAESIYDRLDCDLLIVLKPGETLEVLDDADMLRNGWRRVGD